MFVESCYVLSGSSGSERESLIIVTPFIILSYPFTAIIPLKITDEVEGANCRNHIQYTRVRVSGPRKDANCSAREIPAGGDCEVRGMILSAPTRVGIFKQ